MSSFDWKLRIWEKNKYHKCVNLHYFQCYQTSTSWAKDKKWGKLIKDYWNSFTGSIIHCYKKSAKKYKNKFELYWLRCAVRLFRKCFFGFFPMLILFILINIHKKKLDPAKRSWRFPGSKTDSRVVEKSIVQIESKQVFILTHWVWNNFKLKRMLTYYKVQNLL